MSVVRITFLVALPGLSLPLSPGDRLEISIPNDKYFAGVYEVRESQTDEDNPFLMPRDGVACYDSEITNTRDIFRTIADFLSSLNLILLFRSLFR